MDEQQGKPERRKGPIERMFDWAFALIILVILIGFAWRFAIHPLFFYEMETKPNAIQTVQVERI